MSATVNDSDALLSLALAMSNMTVLIYKAASEQALHDHGVHIAGWNFDYVESPLVLATFVLLLCIIMLCKSYERVGVTTTVCSAPSRRQTQSLCARIMRAHPARRGARIPD